MSARGVIIIKKRNLFYTYTFKSVYNLLGNVFAVHQ